MLCSLLSARNVYKLACTRITLTYIVATNHVLNSQEIIKTYITLYKARLYFCVNKLVARSVRAYVQRESHEIFQMSLHVSRIHTSARS